MSTSPASPCSRILPWTTLTPKKCELILSMTDIVKRDENYYSIKLLANDWGEVDRIHEEFHWANKLGQSQEADLVSETPPELPNHLRNTRLHSFNFIDPYCDELKKNYRIEIIYSVLQETSDEMDGEEHGQSKKSIPDASTTECADSISSDAATSDGSARYSGTFNSGNNNSEPNANSNSNSDSGVTSLPSRPRRYYSLILTKLNSYIVWPRVYEKRLAAIAEKHPLIRAMYERGKAEPCAWETGKSYTYLYLHVERNILSEEEAFNQCPTNVPLHRHVQSDLYFDVLNNSEMKGLYGKNMYEILKARFDQIELEQATESSGSTSPSASSSTSFTAPCLSSSTDSADEKTSVKYTSLWADLKIPLECFAHEGDSWFRIQSHKNFQIDVSDWDEQDVINNFANRLHSEGKIKDESTSIAGSSAVDKTDAEPESQLGWGKGSVVKLDSLEVEEMCSEEHKNTEPLKKQEDNSSDSLGLTRSASERVSACGEFVRRLFFSPARMHNVQVLTPAWYGDWDSDIRVSILRKTLRRSTGQLIGYQYQFVQVSEDSSTCAGYVYELRTTRWNSLSWLLDWRIRVQPQELCRLLRVNVEALMRSKTNRNKKRKREPDSDKIKISCGRMKSDSEPDDIDWLKDLRARIQKSSTSSSKQL